MHLREKEGIEGKTFVVTGGLGFVGAALSLELLRRGAGRVRALDIRSSSTWSSQLLNAGVVSIVGDITCKKDVEKAISGADCVFHVASYGMSGKEMLQFDKMNNININGTCLILDACVEFGVKRLVYVSTCNVVFGGHQVIDGDETLPYLSPKELLDNYSRSKSVAEQQVLKYNGRLLRGKNGGRLYTCAIRPPAIYGPGEDRHMPRSVMLARTGLLMFKIGEPAIKSDWVYIDNLVLALVLASIGLQDDIPPTQLQPVAAGQAYFISDGQPVNSFEFVSRLLKSLNYELPRTSLSVPYALLVGKLFWFCYKMLSPWLNKPWLPEPLFLPAEVYKVGVTHYFSILKANQQLGYVPIVSPEEGMEATISYWHQLQGKSQIKPIFRVQTQAMPVFF